MKGAISRSWPVKGALALLVLGCAAALLAARRPVEQPYPFNHAAHTAKADCTLCHRGARTQARAGLPTVKTCAGCHATAPRISPSKEAERLWKSFTEGRDLPWARLYQVPAHVYFSHRRHATLGGIACAQCHGEMAAATRPPRFAAAEVSMRSCITCHEREQVTVDCNACHR